MLYSEILGDPRYERFLGILWNGEMRNDILFHEGWNALYSFMPKVNNGHSKRVIKDKSQKYC